MKSSPKVIVVGAGIVGSSIAWHLAKAGARVTVVSEDVMGGVATPTSFGWINASWGNPEPYFRLRTRSMREWKRLAAKCPGIPVQWTGGLIWDLPRKRLEAFAAEHASWGYGIRAVDRDEIARIEPALKSPPEFAMHVAEEGMVEAAAAARVLLSDAERAGATVVSERQVLAIERSATGVTAVLHRDRIKADELVLAAGIATPDLAAMVGISVPLDVKPGMIVFSNPFHELLNGVVITPNLALRQGANGHILASGEVGGSDPGDDPARTERNLYRRMRSRFADPSRPAFGFHLISHRPVPRDGFPIVGWGGDRVYVAVMHSGVTLAPAVGLFAAEEILHGRRDPLLSPYGLERFGSFVRPT